MVAQVRAKALVIGNYKSRCNIVQELQCTEFRVIEATECIRGLKHVLEEDPNIVIIGAAKTDADAIRLLRAARCLTTVPIIVVGPGSESDIWQSLANGADAYMPKTCNPVTTIAYVHALLSQN